MEINCYHYISFEILLITLYFIDIDGPSYKLIILNIFSSVIGIVLMIFVVIKKFEPTVLINLLKILRAILVSVSLSTNLQISPILLQIQTLYTNNQIMKNLHILSVSGIQLQDNEFFLNEVQFVLMFVFANLNSDNKYLNKAGNIIVTCIHMLAHLLFFIMIYQTNSNGSTVKEYSAQSNRMKEYFFQQSFKQDRNNRQSICTPQLKLPLQQPQQQEELQPVQEDVSLKNIDSQSDMLINHLPWVQNQQVIVFSEDKSIIYQTFFLGAYLKSNVKISDQDYQKIFLETIIIEANKEVKSQLNQIDFQQDELTRNKTNSEVVKKFRIKNDTSVRDFLSMIFHHYDKCRFFLYIIYKLENTFLELKNLQMRIFLSQIAQKKYSILIFEHQTSENLQVQSIQDEPNSYNNLFSTFLSTALNFINCSLTLTTLSVFDQNVKPDVYLMPIKINSIKFGFFLQNMRDFNQFLDNQLFLKISAFRLTDLIEELILIYEDSCQVRKNQIIQHWEVPDFLSVIYNDMDRLKQVLAYLINQSLNYSVLKKIHFIMSVHHGNCLSIQIKDFDYEDDVYQKNLVKIKDIYKQMKKVRQDVDFAEDLELQIITILSYQLSGQTKKTLEFQKNSSGFCYTIYIESISADPQQQSQTKENSHPIRVIGQKRYYETSLSMILAQQHSEIEESKFTLSKQFSVKPSEVGVDLQSAYFSQLSKIKQDTHLFNQSSKILTNQMSFLQQFQQESIIGQSPFVSAKKSSNKIESVASDSAHPELDFGSEFQTQPPPEFMPKLMSAVIKYKLTKQCCSKVLLVDNDIYALMILEMFLEKYSVKIDKAFNGIQAMDYIQKKTAGCNQCRNRSYLIYFIEIQLPVMKIDYMKYQYKNGHELVKELKSLMKKQSIDRGFAIANTAIIDLNAKLELFKNGMDYYITKPYDLFELSAIIQYLHF